MNGHDDTTLVERAREVYAAHQCGHRWPGATAYRREILAGKHDNENAFRALVAGMLAALSLTARREGVEVTDARSRLTPEYLAMSPLQKWETLTLHGLLGTDEPWIEDMRETLRARATPPPVADDAGERETYRHLKRGTVYEMVGTAELQAEQPQCEHAQLAIYRGEDGKLWARNTGEFHDGRFERLAALSRSGEGLEPPADKATVPIKPTKAMLAAGMAAAEDCLDSDWDSGLDGESHNSYTTLRSDAPKTIWSAMLTAASKEG